MPAGFPSDRAPWLSPRRVAPPLALAFAVSACATVGAQEAALSSAAYVRVRAIDGREKLVLLSDPRLPANLRAEAAAELRAHQRVFLTRQYHGREERIRRFGHGGPREHQPGDADGRARPHAATARASWPGLFQKLPTP
jgi:hypothetical protein